MLSLKAKGAQPFAFFVVLYSATTSSIMDSFVVKLITLTAFLAGGGYVFGQTVTTGLTPQEYISDILLGSGITASNFTFTGFPEQLGHLEGFTPANFPISDGLVMSCGPTSQLIPDTGVILLIHEILSLL